MHFATYTRSPVPVESFKMLFDAFIASPEETLLRLERAVEVSCTSAMGGVDDAVRALRAARDSAIRMYGSAARLTSKQLDRQREQAKQLCSGLEAVVSLCAAAAVPSASTEETLAALCEARRGLETVSRYVYDHARTFQLEVCGDVGADTFACLDLDAVDVFGTHFKADVTDAAGLAAMLPRGADRALVLSARNSDGIGRSAFKLLPDDVGVTFVGDATATWQCHDTCDGDVVIKYTVGWSAGDVRMAVNVLGINILTKRCVRLSAPP